MVANQIDLQTDKILKVIDKPCVSLVKTNEKISDTNNISELLAGNIDNNQNNIIDIPNNNIPQNNKTNKEPPSLVTHILAGLIKVLIKGTLFGMTLVILSKFHYSGKLFKALAETKTTKTIQKILRPKFIKKELRLRRMQLAKFKPVEFKKGNNIEEIKRFGKKLGIKIQGTEADVNELNDTLSVLTDLNNQSKGRITLPKTLSIHETLGLFTAGTAQQIGLKICLCRNSSRTTLLHELGHINHFNKLGFIRSEILDGSKFKDFGIDKNTLDYIESILGKYATTSPYEFVAECYKELLQGVKLPDKIIQMYRMFKGPMNWLYIKKPIDCNVISIKKIINFIKEGFFKIISLDEFKK